MIKFFKILISTVVLLLLVVAVGGYVFIKTFDFNRYKGMVTELVSKELGRKLVIKGDASIGISLVPTIVLEDVELANATWAQNPQMVKIEKLEITFAIMPLFHKQIEIDNINLVRPQIDLEVSKQGQENWIFELPAAPKAEQNYSAAPAKSSANLEVEVQEVNSAGAALVGFAAKDVSIENGLLNYANHQTGDKINLQINSVEMLAESMNDDITLSFDLLYNQQVIKGKLISGSVNSFLQNQEPFPLQLNASAYGINAAIKGTVSDALNKVSYNLDTNIYNPAGNFGAPETTLIANIQGDLQEVRAMISSLNVVNNVIKGNLRANISGKIPYVNADLQSDKINLLNFNKNSNMASMMPELISSAQAGDIVPNDPIPFDLLRMVNADVKLRIAKLIMAQGMQANNVNLSAQLNGGNLNVSSLQLGFGGGEIMSSLQANAAAQSVVLKMVSKNMNLQNLHQEFQIIGANDFGVESGGAIDLDINLQGNGSTYRQLVNSLNGQVIGIVGKSVIQTGKLDFVTNNFISQLLSALQIKQDGPRNLNMTCAVVRSDLGSGRAVFPRGIVVDSKQLKVVSDGNINLTNDKINFSIKPNWMQNIKGLNVAQALAAFIKIKGTLQDPKIVIDDASAAKAIIGVAATGGTAYLGSQLLMEGDASPCYTALKGTAYQNRFPAPSGVSAASQDVYQDTEQQIDNGIKDLKNTAKDIIGIFKKGL